MFPPIQNEEHNQYKAYKERELDQSWFKDRISIMDAYKHVETTIFHYDSFKTTLFGYWWKHCQIQVWGYVIEFTIRLGKIST